MPKLNGLATMVQIKKDELLKGIPIFMVSGDPKEIDVELCNTCNVTLVKKPADYIVLQQRFKALLSAL